MKRVLSASLREYAETPDRFSHVVLRSKRRTLRRRAHLHPPGTDMGFGERGVGRRRRSRRAARGRPCTRARRQAGRLVDRPVCTAARSLRTAAGARTARATRSRLAASRARAYATAEHAARRNRGPPHRDVRGLRRRARSAVGRVRDARGPPGEEPSALPGRLRANRSDSKSRSDSSRPWTAGRRRPHTRSPPTAASS